MVHFRVADAFINNIAEKIRIPFIVGNIGPDCGDPNEDFSNFSPPINVTHWTTDDLKANIKADEFFNTYIKNNTKSEKFPFYLGYYTHLLVDKEWSMDIFIPTIEKWIMKVENNVNFISTIKKDWYDLDHLFLKDNIDFRTFRIFDKIKNFPNQYLDYYNEDAFNKQITYISRFYNDFSGDLNHEYLYLSKEKMDNFVTSSINKVAYLLLLKEISL